MLNEIPARLQRKLDVRTAENALRGLRHFDAAIDFSSNDYLGYAQHPFIREQVIRQLETWKRTGSSGSRLLTGTHPAMEELEARVAAFHHAPAALLFGSGYEANSGLLSAIAGKDDTILYDSLCHASMREGIQLSPGRSLSFKHNDVQDLERKLSSASGEKYVVTESVFSMDGDTAPLIDLAGICRRHGAYLIVDEAHATGVMGKGGVGMVAHFQLEEEVFARVYTFGKELGQQGAAVACSEKLRSYLINFCRPFIYSTAPALALVAAVQAAYDLLERDNTALASLQKLMEESIALLPVSGMPTAIRTIIVPGNDRVKEVAGMLQQNGFLVLPVLSPTVPAGAERLRICLHAFNTMEQVSALAGLLKKSGVA